tara:strand:- start:415 stop:954 length:540 start_codon:yes stop_codon:yes gene_type:complete
MNNEIIKLISHLLGQRESNSPIDWNDLENNFEELEEIISKALENPKLFELGDDFSDNCKMMLECISELDDDIIAYSGKNGDENEEEQKDRLSEKLHTLGTTLDETITKLKSVLPDSKSMFNYDEQMNQRSKAALDAIRKVAKFQSGADFYIKINGGKKYNSELERLKKIRNEIFNRNVP